MPEFLSSGFTLFKSYPVPGTLMLLAVVSVIAMLRQRREDAPVSRSLAELLSQDQRRRTAEDSRGGHPADPRFDDQEQRFLTSLFQPPQRPTLHAFVHRALPDAVFSREPALLAALEQVREGLASRLDPRLCEALVLQKAAVCYSARPESEYQTSLTALRAGAAARVYRRDGFVRYQLKLPEPREPGEAFLAVVVHADEAGAVGPETLSRYFVLEKSYPQQPPTLCEILSDGSRVPFEIRCEATAESVEAVLHTLLGSRARVSVAEPVPSRSR